LRRTKGCVAFGLHRSAADALAVEWRKERRRGASLWARAARSRRRRGAFRAAAAFSDEAQRGHDVQRLSGAAQLCVRRGEHAGRLQPVLRGARRGQGGAAARVRVAEGTEVWRGWPRVGKVGGQPDCIGRRRSSSSSSSSSFSSSSSGSSHSSGSGSSEDGRARTAH
jgi:hypothetical protein